MRNAHPRYMCYPSVVCVGTMTKVTIFPRDNSRIFRSDKQYELSVVGLLDDMIDYHDSIPKTNEVTVENGCLCFTYTFESEQEYSIRFCEKGEKEIRISMYALNEDLYSLRPLKGDFHTHSWYSDGQDGLTMTPADYREEGFDFFALTDHNRMYTSRLASKLYDGIPLGIHIMTGEEVHTPGSALHIVHVGGKHSVCDKYIKDPDGYNKAVDNIEKTMTHIPDQYRRRTAMAKWACEEIKKADGVSILAHPFWCPNRYNASKEFHEILFNEHMFDVLELLNGVGNTVNNQQLALWNEQTAKGNYLPVVGSSDSHNHDFEKTRFGRCFTVVFAKDNTTDAILDAVRNNLSVAADIPLNDNTEIRFYSKNLRLVMLCHFLYNNYFNETWRLCIGEGILMRRYAEGEEVGDLLAALADTTKTFYERFYGILPPPEITQRVLEFLEESRQIQCTEGPLTKGSHLFIYGKNNRRE